MSSFLKTLALTLFFTLSLSSVANAGPGHKMPPDNSSPELHRLKSLEGHWSTVTSMFGKKDQKMFVEYEVTAGGSAVLEKIFPGTPYEMISVYHDDNKGKLAMTHYCMMRNRPTLKLANSTKDSITLHVTKVDGVKSSKKESMGDIKIVFKDKNHFETTCSSKKKGKDATPPMTMAYTRVK